jgi:hypothetical protein
MGYKREEIDYLCSTELLGQEEDQIEDLFLPQAKDDEATVDDGSTKADSINVDEHLLAPIADSDTHSLIDNILRASAGVEEDDDVSDYLIGLNDMRCGEHRRYRQVQRQLDLELDGESAIEADDDLEDPFLMTRQQIVQHDLDALQAEVDVLCKRAKKNDADIKKNEKELARALAAEKEEDKKVADAAKAAKPKSWKAYNEDVFDIKQHHVVTGPLLKYTKQVLVRVRNKFGVPENTVANRMAIRRFAYDHMAQRGLREDHIAMHLDKVIAMAFIPSDSQIENNNLEWAHRGCERRMEERKHRELGVMERMFWNIRWAFKQQ